MINLSKEQLSKLVIHTMSISTILLEACILPEREEEPQADEDEPEADIFENLPWEPDAEGIFRDELLDAICGKWGGKGRKQPGLLVLQTATGYMAVYGKMDKKKQIFPDLFHLYREREYAYFDNGDERIYISRHEGSDTLTLSPGGEYSRIPEESVK